VYDRFMTSVGGVASAGRDGGELGPVRVLHVEDDAAFADLTATYLERNDTGPQVSVTTETTPEAALDALANGNVDCVVSDYDMPEMTGLDLLDAVRENHPELPFILFTGKGSEEIASEAISRGVTDYLQKDVGTDQYAVLANRIRNAVTRQRAREEARRGEQRLRRALDLLPQCVVVKNLNGEYLLANEAAADMYGMPREEVEASNERELLPDDIADKFRAEDKEVVESGEQLRIEEQHVEDDVGGERVERVTKIPFDAPGTDDPAVLVIAEDRTGEATRRTRLAEAADRIEDAQAELGDGDPDLEAVRSALTAAHEYAVGDREPIRRE
jgi:PAS domain S-box-containing protein